MEQDDMLDWMLDAAKKKPMKIHHDFDTRFRVWENQILKNRLRAIISTGGNHEYIERMTDLVLNDYFRLGELTHKEFMINKNLDQYHKRYNELFTTTKKIIQLYEEQEHD